jgi:hypothetical protein
MVREPALVWARQANEGIRNWRGPSIYSIHHTHTRRTYTMADSDNATRAPESDAQEKPVDPAVEQSVFPGDTRAQEGPSMGVSQAEHRV